MSTPYAVPVNCKISASFNFLCDFRQINPTSLVDYRTDDGNEEEEIGMMERLNQRGIPGRKRRFSDGSTRAKYTGTRIGKRSEEGLGWNFYDRVL